MSYLYEGFRLACMASAVIAAVLGAEALEASSPTVGLWLPLSGALLAAPIVLEARASIVRLRRLRALERRS